MKNNKRKNGRNGMDSRPESCPQRILRKVFHEGNPEAMEPRELYDVTVHAVMQEKNLSYQDLKDVAKEMMRLDRRAMQAGGFCGDAAIDIRLRASQEANVLEWAMDEISAALRPGN